MDALLTANEEQIVETEGVGPVMAATLIEWLSENRTRELIERLRGLGLQLEQEGGPIPGTEGPLAGKTFVITGSLPNLSREVATERLEAAGAKVTNSVSKKTSYLVLGAEPGSKLAKAEKLGTEILDEDGLLALLDEG
jgi:DNA ligase (NAD+)